MTTAATGPSDPPATRDENGILGRENLALAVNAYLMADKAHRDGNAAAAEERGRQLEAIQSRYWRVFFSILSQGLSRRRQGLEFTDEERLFLDVGLVDARMLGDDRDQVMRELTAEITHKGLSNCYYLSEWLAYRYGQLQLESTLNLAEDEGDYFSQLRETRVRVLSRLASYFTGLPGIPLEVSEAMRSGDLDNSLLAAGIAALREPRRKQFFRRRNLSLLREQVLAKAKARASSQATLRLFEMLDEIYVREWRERYDTFVNEGFCRLPNAPAAGPDQATLSVGNAGAGAVVGIARQIRMGMVLM
ncbi:MAG: hypothetical protein LIP77_00100, partial [Planctomycetes bacterium]|nr:hypothetical protein [Planctomycetota bacterium]